MRKKEVFISCCILLTSLFFTFASCENKPFINSTLKAEKAGDCTNELPAAQINKNINGERYEFASCLQDGFDEKNFTVTRQGDTLLFNTPPPSANAKTALYKLTLDIDAYPQYKYIKIGGEVLDIGISAN
jgi:hypothetical protein